MYTLFEILVIVIVIGVFASIIIYIALSKNLKREAMRIKRRIESLDTPEQKIHYLLTTGGTINGRSLNRFEISSMANLSEAETRQALDVLLQRGIIREIPPLSKVAKKAGSDANEYCRYTLA